METKIIMEILYFNPIRISDPYIDLAEEDNVDIWLGLKNPPVEDKKWPPGCRCDNLPL